MAIDPVIGTLVGTALGGGLGYATQRAQSRREERRRWETTRYEAALGVLATCDRIVNRCGELLHELNLGQRGDPEPDDLQPWYDEIATVSARLELVCSHREGQALHRLQTAARLVIGLIAGANDDVNPFVAFAEARDDFITVTHRELGT